MKYLAIILYITGLSLRAIASIVNVSPKAVLDWVRTFGAATYEKPTPKGEVIVELDEMWHFLTSKKQALDLESVLSYYRSTRRLGMWKT
jgi:hypothetical protein